MIVLLLENQKHKLHIDIHGLPLSNGRVLTLHVPPFTAPMLPVLIISDTWQASPSKA